MPNGTTEAPRLNPVAADLLASAVAVLSQHFGAPFHYYEMGSLEPVIPTEPSSYLPPQPEWLVHVARQAAPIGQVSVQPISELLQALVLPLKRGSQTELLAIGIFATRPLAGANDLEEIASWVGDDGTAEEVRFCQPELLERIGLAALASLNDRLQLHTREVELRQLAAQLSRNYEEITLLHHLNRASQVSQGTRELQDLTLSLMSEMLPIRQIAFVDAKKETVSSVGESVLLPQQCRDLIGALGAPNAREVVVENHVSRRGLAAELAQVQRLICVPVVEGKELFGWLLALGTTDGSELGTVEASLMTAVGAILATHQTNVRLFGSIKDLFLGVVRALSSAIDAKDPYTCGHSERVARLARRLAQRLGLPEEERNRIYLSGLLHDVGKIGIRDAVLLKPGRLTPEEMAHIQEHPRIGFDILSGVRQLKAVLPGVRNHHESLDGTGYPDRLQGEGIPLMARIIAVADSYDAMSSDRPYRKGLKSEQIEQILRDGAGKQWDGQVIEAMLAIFVERKQRQADPSAGPSDGCPAEGRFSSADSDQSFLDPSNILKIISLSSS